MKKVKLIVFIVAAVLVMALYGLLVMIYIEQVSKPEPTPNETVSTTQAAPGTTENSVPPTTEPTVPPTTEPTVPPTTLPPPTVPPTTVPPVTVPPADPWTPTMELPQDNPLTAKYALVWDVTNNQLLLSAGDMSARIYPASITKLFTAYAILEVMAPEDQVTVGEALSLVNANSSLAGIRKGYVMTVEQLIEGMLLPSGNDAAYVLACAAGRILANDPDLAARQAVNTFLGHMNATAKALGTTRTYFCNPDGFHHENLYTNMRDLSILSRAALSDPRIVSITSRNSHKVTFVSGQNWTFYNTNALVDPDSPYYSPYAIGLKTGNTTKAGHCLVSAFRVDGRELLVITMDCDTKDSKFSDTLYLLDLVLK